MGSPKRSPFYFAAAAFLFGAQCTSGQQAEPTSSPILRIAMDRHVDHITGSAIDPDGRFLVTASDDKTARLWDIASGQTLAVLRPPSDNSTGKLAAAAISKNADLVFVAGETDTRWFGGNAVFVFDRHGRLVRVIERFPGRITGLAVTADDRHLIVGGVVKIQVYDLSDYSLVASSPARVYRGLAVSRTGAIAYAAYVERHDTLTLCQLSGKTLNCEAKVSSREGFSFSSPSFSEDGTTLVISDRHFFPTVKVTDQSAVVHFYSVPQLAEVRSQTTEGFGTNGIANMGWTPGDCLFASAPGRVRMWTSISGGAARNFEMSWNSEIYPVGSCSALLLTNGPEAALYRIERNSESAGQPLVKVGGSVGPVWTGPVGDWRSVPIPRRTTSPIPTFKMKERQIEGTVPQSRKVVTGFSMASPAQLGRSLRENRGTDQLSNVFVLENRTAVLVSFENRVELVTSDDKVVWSVPAPARAFGIGLSNDKKVVACFFPDNVARWYRFSDGREFLAGFIHPDERRWVLWTPSGYYDAGPGSEDLIGWQVNQGRYKAADFFPVSRFRQAFYRPDIIDHVLDTLDEKQSIELAGRKGSTSNQQASVEKSLPPVVEILIPQSSIGTKTTTVKVRISVRTSKDAPVTSVRVRVNGRSVKVDVARDLVLERTDQDVRELIVSVPAEDSDILIFAESKNGMSSPAILPVKWEGPRAEVRTTAGAARPKLYLLAIGVSEYKNPQYKLDFAAKDAKDFAAAFVAQNNRLYREVETRILTDRTATRDAVLDGLEWLQRQVTARDVGILFLAGHGINTPDGVYYFAPTEFDLNSIKRTGVVFSEIKNTLSGLAGKALFFVDTCHSGNVLGGRRALPDVNAIINELSSVENGVVVFSSATGREAAFENAEWGNGAFTKALIEGINGKADYGNTGRVTHRSLDLYLSERVKQLTQGRQHPVTQAPGGAPDFPIALVRQ